MTDPLFWLLAVAVVFIVALSKSGLLGSLGLIGVPVLSLAMPAREAAGMMLPVLLCMDAVGLLAYRKQFDNFITVSCPGPLVLIDGEMKDEDIETYCKENFEELLQKMKPTAGTSFKRSVHFILGSVQMTSL